MKALTEKSMLIPSAHKLDIEIINKFAGGDISNNQEVMKNLPKTPITDQVLVAAKKGTPIIRFGRKKAPAILVLAGVHGNEYPAQIAAVHLINKLSVSELNITVYVIPFAIPFSTEKSLRSWKGQDPNRTANLYGTPTNNILCFSKMNNIRYLGDFHSTRPGGYPGRLSVLCSEMPCLLSFQMADFIEKETKSTLLSFTKAGSIYPGALEDVFNLAGIPAVTGEAMSVHGTVLPGSIQASMEQMESFLNFHKAVNKKEQKT
ncbi:succinylglutamate desuccinylase/aspartoacylase domain-containing protein [Methanobacterium sp. ACI-7]|uniref:succinylglutamate desuccinylase/aspartoacylase domain-containing protein n=1 Tax=unclassified Methanobacterium TaxID=2627676 RepID=UPI0039C2A0B8